MGATPPPGYGGLGGGGAGGSKVSPALLSFNAGELAPTLEGRIDIPKYNAGCYQCVNFVPMVQGPARRRSGTRYVTATKNSAVQSWLMPFRFSVTQSYILEWGDRTLRFYTNRGQVLGPAEPNWNTAFFGTTVDGSVTWRNILFPGWTPNFTYTAGSAILDPNGSLQLCTTAGTSGPVPPPFQTVSAKNPDGTTIGPYGGTPDGSVVWTNVALPRWAPGETLAINLPIYTVAGIQQVVVAGTTGTGSVTYPYEIPTPYAASALTDAQGCFALDYMQSLDVIYLTHESQDYPPYKLERSGGAAWGVVKPNFQGGPFQPLNAVQSACVFANAQNGTITIYSSAPIFPPSVVGSQIFLQQSDLQAIQAWEPATGTAVGVRRRYLLVTYKAIKVGTSGKTGTAPPVHTQGTAWDGSNGNVLWEYQDAGTGTALITAVGTSSPGGATFAITGATSANPVVITAPGHTFPNGATVFVSGLVGIPSINNQFYVVASAATNTFALNMTDGSNVNGVGFDPYIGGGTASSILYTCTANVITQIPYSCVNSDNSTSLWALSAWNKGAYPSCVKFFRNRLFFAAPGFLWGSASADYENFNGLDPSGNVTPAQAISAITSSKEPVQWMLDGDALAIGTAGGEEAAAEIDSSQPLGPANMAIKSQLPWGSKRIQAIKIGVDIFYVQTSGRTVRNFEFSFVQDQYTSSDVTALADHIAIANHPTNTSIRNFTAMSYAQEPDSILWCVRADGILCGFTINKEQDVMGWHRHQLGGGGIVESVATIPSPNGDVDDLWLIVRRTINGVTTRYVEWLTRGFDYNTPLTSAFFVDAGLTYQGAPTKNISGLTHLVGATVDVLADGADAGQLVVSNTGTIMLPYAASAVSVGLPMPAYLSKMRLEAGSPFGAQYATQQGQTKRITNLTLRLWSSMGGYYGSWDNYIRDQGVPGTAPSAGILDDIDYRDPSMPMDTAIPLFTGDTGYSAFNFPMGYEREARIMVLADRPLPMTVVALLPQFENADRD